MKDDYGSFFDNFRLRYLTGNFNTCEPNWTEVNVSYIFHKFYYFTGGKGSIRVESDNFTPLPGDLYFIPAHTVHSHRHDPADPVTQYWAHFEAETGGGRYFTYHKKTLFCRPDRDRTIKYFSQLTCDSRGSFFSLESKIALMELMKLFLENVKPDFLLHSDESSLINRVDAYVQDNIQEDICLADLASLANRQPNYFISSFKKAYGVTPMEYVNRIRLKEANRLLTENRDMKISTAALAVGFKDYRYFTRLYKRKYGMTPSRLQRL